MVTEGWTPRERVEPRIKLLMTVEVNRKHLLVVASNSLVGPLHTSRDDARHLLLEDVCVNIPVPPELACFPRIGDNSSMTEEFDFIVVGAGSAGCVLANHASRAPEHKVLVLEAGPPDDHQSLAMPAAFTVAKRSAHFDWGYWTEPESYLYHRRMTVPRGRVLGGSSSINAMAFVRGNRADFDAWAALPGLDSWSYERCLPVFKQLECYNGTDSDYRGADGPLAVTAPQYTTPLCDVFLRAAEQAGYARDIDTNAESQSGFGVWDQTISKGVRISTARAYLHPVAHRPNLVVRSRALVRRLLIRNRRVVGIEYQRAGDIHRAYAAGEVLIAAGSINSPKLLMLSGIGDADHLGRLRIPLTQHLPGVGGNLIDHLDVKVRHESDSWIGSGRHLRFDRRLGLALQWFFARRGPGATNHFEVVGYVPVHDDSELPDVQLGLIPLLVDDDGNPINDGHGFQASVMGLRPLSRGRVRLRSDDPAAPPTIRFNYLQRQEDVVVLREGVRRLREIFAQQAFDFCRGPEVTPGASVMDDDALDDFIRAECISTHHPTGTCRMGVDENAVVDAQGRVHGLSGVRVVDASIMPFITSGNINAPTIMMAEKISQVAFG